MLPRSWVIGLIAAAALFTAGCVGAGETSLAVGTGAPPILPGSVLEDTETEISLTIADFSSLDLSILAESEYVGQLQQEAAQVPEPGSALLVALGLTTVAVGRRLRIHGTRG